MRSPVVDRDIAKFQQSDLVVLRGAFDPTPLTHEFDRALTDAFRLGHRSNTGRAGNMFEYVPMMCHLTPVSLSLLDTLAGTAARLLGREVLPTRAKGVRYFGETPWHRDSDLGVPSLGMVAYLDTLDSQNGALRVIERSRLDDNPPPDRDDGEPVSTAAGDVIAFDEHLLHCSTGGGTRRQWRVDFVVDPADAGEEHLVRSYFARIFHEGWDGGYDIVRYPSYDTAWRRSGQRWSERLSLLGVYDAADKEEAWARTNRAL